MVAKLFETEKFIKENYIKGESELRSNGRTLKIEKKKDINNHKTFIYMTFVV